MKPIVKLKYLEDKWDKNIASQLDEGDQLRYRSNLLGSDLRITNFGGGSTSSKIMEFDPFAGLKTEVLWVKGSGGDLGSIEKDGLSKLYMDKLLSLPERYRGVEIEDEMVENYSLCTFGPAGRPASIDTPSHGFIPFKHVDHMHPDWVIAMAASANGQEMMQKFNEQFNRKLVWLPCQRPGFELSMMLANAIEENPDADSIILASHGLFTWGNTQHECYRNTIEMIDQMGQFMVPKIEAKGTSLFGGIIYETREDRRDLAAKIFPVIRGKVSENKKVIGDYVELPEVLRFVNSNDAEKLSYQGTPCLDHFIRTKLRPLYLRWDVANGDIDSLKEALDKGIADYRVDYQAYYNAHKKPDSTAIRDANPTVVLVPGIGMFSFGKNKKEARVTGEFYVNAIHIIEGATAMENGNTDEGINLDHVVNNYVALEPGKAFEIEYGALEEAKIQRMPKEKEMARQVAVVIGAGSGIGREFSIKLASEGAHVVVADLNKESAENTHKEIVEKFGSEVSFPLSVNITDRETVKDAFVKAVETFGGVDVLVNTAAIVVYPDKGSSYTDKVWDRTLQINVTGNYIISEEFADVISAQGTNGSVLLTSSANAVIPKKGSEPYDVSKSAVNHLIRELSIRFSDNLRINGVSPATVIEGSAMFPRERVIANLTKYNIQFDDWEATSQLISKLAQFYADRTLTKRPIRSIDVVEAGYFLITEKANCTTGHIIPVDGGLTEAFLR